MIPVLRNEYVMTRHAKEIAAVVAGETPDEEILPGMKWNECVYKEVLKKCSLEAVPEMFKLLEVSNWAWKGALGEVQYRLQQLEQLLEPVLDLLLVVLVPYLEPLVEQSVE